jgi:hypothetical protein
MNIILGVPKSNVGLKMNQLRYDIMLRIRKYYVMLCLCLKKVITQKITFKNNIIKKQ